MDDNLTTKVRLPARYHIILASVYMLCSYLIYFTFQLEQPVTTSLGSLWDEEPGRALDVLMTSGRQL